MILSAFLTCFVALVVMTVLLLAFGPRARVSSTVVGALLALVVTAAAGELAAWAWHLPASDVEVGQAVLLLAMLVMVTSRSAWNVIGQLFFGAFVASAVTYLWFAVVSTTDPGLSVAARIASALLLLLELAALAISASYTFEGCDAVCRVRRTRPEPVFDDGYLPMVSLQLAAYNEPPDMLIETIASLEAIDYPNLEIVIIDNNTKDPEVWTPVRDYCATRERVRFVHVDPWPGYKSGALNLVLERYTHPDAEIVGIVDADYQIDPAWLRSLVGYFADPKVAFVQSPQDYREYEHDGYLTACYDAYKYFFAATMPARHERNSIIFAGTMGLLRRKVIEEVGGWDEWCITEDAELSLRMLRAGYEGVYVPQSFGQGIMPLTFDALKSQRFRWCFGGMQILRLHWRDLLPGRRTERNQLTLAQRVDYFLGSVQWMNDLVNLGFTVVLLASALIVLHTGPVGLRPLYGAAVLLPASLLCTGVLRGLWSLRVKTHISVRRATLAFVNWLSLSWVVAIACVQGMFRGQGVFLRTPKDEDRNHLIDALRSARVETALFVVLWATAVYLVARGTSAWFLCALLVWQGVLYASAPFTAWLNQHTELTAQLERRRRSEWRRERAAAMKPYYVGGLAGASVAIAFALIVTYGGTNPGQPRNPFATPRQEQGDQGPIANLVGDNGDQSTSSSSSSSSSDEATTTTVPVRSTTSTARTTVTTTEPASSSSDATTTTTVP